MKLKICQYSWPIIFKSIIDVKEYIENTKESWNDLCQNNTCNPCSQKVILGYRSSYLNLTDNVLLLFQKLRNYVLLCAMSVFVLLI